MTAPKNPLPRKNLFDFIEHIYPCEEKTGGYCGSYGLCANCSEAHCVEAGFEIAEKEHEALLEAERQRSAKLVEALEDVSTIGTGEGHEAVLIAREALAAWREGEK